MKDNFDTARIEHQYVKAWLDARTEQAQHLPPYSAGVPDSIANTVRTIEAANRQGNKP